MLHRASFAALLISWLLTLPTLHAEAVMGDFDFSEGNWALIGVPVHNYQLLPVQTELGTFVTEDRELLKTLQRRWHFDMTFDDKCDYHYALKLYRDGELMTTYKLNLHCGYITYDGFSYTFPIGEFDLLRDQSRRIPWSRIRFDDPETLKRAIRRLETSEDVYWYDDVEQYMFPGYFMISVNNLPWNADRDSVHREISQYIFELTHSDQFYLKEYYYLVQDGNMYIRYLINCDEQLARMFGEQHSAFFRWRSHFQEANGTVSILALGVDESRFRYLMRE